MSLRNAVLQNDLNGAEQLLKQGHDVNVKDATSLTPLMIAAGLGNSQMVELLLTAGADVYVLDSQMGASALHKAAQSGVVDVAKLLVQRGAFVNAQSPILGSTPLHDAIWHKKPQIVAYLLEQGARTEVKTHSGLKPMDIAKTYQLTEITRLLQERQQIEAQKLEAQKLMVAVKKNDVAEVKKLIAQGVDINERAPMLNTADDGHTPLLVAARDGYTDIVRELLQAGANPRLLDPMMNSSPGHKAAYEGHPEVAQLLVADGRFDLDAQGPYNGYTALHDAIWHGHIETVKVLLDAGASLDLRTHTGKTPAELAIEYNYHEIAMLIQMKDTVETIKK